MFYMRFMLFVLCFYLNFIFPNEFLVPPKIDEFKFADRLNVGDRTSIQCVVGTGDLPLTFTWLKDGIPIKTSSVRKSDNSETNVEEKFSHSIENKFISIRQTGDFTSALSILNITKHQAGDYTCRVQNDAATVEHSAQLSVNGKLDLNGRSHEFCFTVYSVH